MNSGDVPVFGFGEGVFARPGGEEVGEGGRPVEGVFPGGELAEPFGQFRCAPGGLQQSSGGHRSDVQFAGQLGR
ncbi:MAG: hypothetical protein KJO17_13630 [Acidimicrobiia bacterium]|nr:hypothetical protein [Acidimicrobiia bacterium]NNL71132.1 hypothetical protein [Acidimicrobiia bacterium]